MEKVVTYMNDEILTKTFSFEKAEVPKIHGSSLYLMKFPKSISKPKKTMVQYIDKANKKKYLKLLSKHAPSLKVKSRKDKSPRKTHNG